LAVETGRTRTRFPTPRGTFGHDQTAVGVGAFDDPFVGAFDDPSWVSFACNGLSWAPAPTGYDAIPTLVNRTKGHGDHSQSPRAKIFAKGEIPIPKGKGAIWHPFCFGVGA